MATDSATTSPSTYRQMFSIIMSSFADSADVATCYAIACPGRAIDDQEIVGITFPLEELVLRDLEAYGSEVLSNRNSPHYMLKDVIPFIEKYMIWFDVAPSGPDLLKYTLAFGLGLEAYAKKTAERPIVTKIVQIQTVRRVRTVAGLARADRVPPPVVMAKKILKVWNEERRSDLLGQYGTYVAFKTWSLG